MDRNYKIASDNAIIELYFKRDQSAIEQTERKYSSLLYRISWNILHDRLDAEECLNDTYLGLWNAIPPTRPASLRAFASQIVRRISVNRYNEKSAKRRVPSEFTVALEELEASLSSATTVEAEYESTELAGLFDAFIASLTSRERYIFIGRYYMAETLTELASELHIGVGTVHRELERIRTGLKNYLERNGIEL